MYNAIEAIASSGGSNSVYESVIKNQWLFKKSLIKSLKSNVVFAEDGLKINL
ncbi:hypothetical protein NQU47_00100 [Pseudoalteromonas distincta]|uniref:Uncharacterized protein n=1 Tax=Pseudoalteromonas distincta TaxID=77608 RepID=A0ABT9GEW2_9GAMM|nr:MULTISPECIES: hypothetical protein [Pseudoalteromonas]MBB1305778.1 hypothetical protein [Pseudoalteromonas sp. SR43-5]MDC3210954.1 hypothetical protein [Pseudoalteromonas distincta]MDP4484415.1 hypothetical protein [Pseudoalteromonas elyakovii]